MDSPLNKHVFTSKPAQSKKDHHKNYTPFANSQPIAQPDNNQCLILTRPEEKNIIASIPNI